MRFRFDLFLSDDFRKESISILELSKATHSALMRNGINKVEDIIEKWDDIKYLRGVGAKRVKEIKSAIFNANIVNMSEKQLKQFINDFVITEREENGEDNFTAA